MTDSRYQALEAVWTSAREDGSLGSVAINDLREHSAGYVPSTMHLQQGARCVDLGTGVGIPGLLIAMLHPDTTWRLLDANVRRCEIARRAVRVVGLADRIEVVHGRADEYAHDACWRATCDLVVARLFGPPGEVAECGLPLLAQGGSLVVSVSPKTANAWRSADLSRLAASLVDEWKTSSGSYLRVQRTGTTIANRLPRREAARRRVPLF